MKRFSFTIEVLFLSLFLAGLAAAACLTHPAAARENQSANYLVFQPFLVNRHPSRVVVEVQKNHSAYETPWGSVRVVGEVENQTGGTVSDVEVAVHLYDDDDDLIETREGKIFLNLLPNGARTCFEVVFPYAPLDWESYEFAEVSYDQDLRSPPNLNVRNLDGDYDAASGDYFLDGEIRNEAGRTVNCVRAVGTLYTASGKVVDCGYAYVDGIHLGSGRRAGFQIEFYGRKFSDVDNYRVQADGEP